MLAALIVAMVGPPSPVALVHHPVSTKVAAAQDRFDQGLTLVYSFNRNEARVRFEAAAKADPKLAMAWWGVAMAAGPNINERMAAGDISVAADALSKAKALEDGATPEERRFIDALATRYPGDAKADTSKPYAAYRDAMKALVADYPDDLDAATLYAESIMDVSDFGFNAGVPTPEQTALVGILASVLARDPKHIGANHFMIHAWDYPGVADRALASATYLSNLTYEPADSHLQHMPGHTFLDVGNFSEMLRVGRLSTLDDDAFAKNAGVDPFSLYYHGHNLAFWAGAALLSGERGEIDQATAEYVRSGDPGAIVMFLAQGRYADVDAFPMPTKPFQMAEWYYARCISALVRGDMIAANENAKSLDALIRDRFKVAPSDFFLGAFAHARIAHAHGDDDTALALLREQLASSAEAAPESSEPWFFPAGKWVADILFERGDLEGAESAYRADLLRVPNNPRVLYGLMRTLTRENRIDDARALAPRIAAQWLGDSLDLHEAPI